MEKETFLTLNLHCVGRLLSCVVFSFLERDLPVTEDLMHSDFKVNLLF